jgi:4-hydroxybenzoate polyprenyltransferase
MTSSQFESQTFAGSSPIVAYINLVKLPHTVFALPFALLGVVYASWSAPVAWHQVLLVVVAFTAARFAAMGYNRIVDQRIDTLNPRTRNREIPTGRISIAPAMGAVGAAAVLFFASAALLNRLCLMLSPLALAWIWAYSYTKRFTSWSHLWLGAALAIAPVGGFLAITGTWSSPWWTLVVLAGSVATWVGGFDILYALQDEGFDRAHGLHSAVVLLGRSRSVLMARVLHGLALVGLVLFGSGMGAGSLYYAGVALAALLLGWEHRLVKPTDLSKLDAAFFTMNGVISMVVFLGVLGDRLW